MNIDKVYTKIQDNNIKIFPSDLKGIKSVSI